MADSTLFTVTVDEQLYDVAHAGDDLRVSPRGSEDLAETVSIAHLPQEARQALDDGDIDDVALREAAAAIARAIADRGA
jgi:hypothetical protein